jgi:DUF4097 and DUF4098 domain-containing protein YvlB
MARLRSRSGSIFSGVALLAVGALLLLHNYRGYELSAFLWHWWPLLLILLGGIKLYERTVGARTNDSNPSAINAGEIVLVVGLLALVGIVVGIDYAKGRLSENIGIDLGRNSFDSDIEVAPKSIAPNARVTVRGSHGDISVRAADSSEIRITGKATARAWDQDEAERTAKAMGIEIVQNGDGYEIHPTGSGAGSAGNSVDMEISVPLKATVAIRNDKGDISVSGMHTPVTINSGNGDIEVRDTSGDVDIDMRKGDVRVSDARGDVKISGQGGDVEVSTISGSLTLNGEFFGSVRLDKLAKGLRIISNRTDLTLTQLSGHLERSSGSLEIADAPGDLTLRTSRYDVSIENPGGKVKIDDRDGDISVRLSSPPKDDIDITNSSGAISLSIPNDSSFQVQADCRSGDIVTEFESLQRTTTSSGDSHLEGKVGSARGPRITLRTTYKNISLTKTS